MTKAGQGHFHADIEPNERGATMEFHTALIGFVSISLDVCLAVSH